MFHGAAVIILLASEPLTSAQIYSLRRPRFHSSSLPLPYAALHSAPRTAGRQAAGRHRHRVGPYRLPVARAAVSDKDGDKDEESFSPAGMQYPPRAAEDAFPADWPTPDQHGGFQEYTVDGGEDEQDAFAGADPGWPTPDQHGSSQEYAVDDEQEESFAAPGMQYPPREYTVDGGEDPREAAFAAAGLDWPAPEDAYSSPQDPLWDTVRDQGPPREALGRAEEQQEMLAERDLLELNMDYRRMIRRSEEMFTLMAYQGFVDFGRGAIFVNFDEREAYESDGGRVDESVLDSASSQFVPLNMWEWIQPERKAEAAEVIQILTTIKQYDPRTQIVMACQKEGVSEAIIVRPSVPPPVLAEQMLKKKQKKEMKVPWEVDPDDEETLEEREAANAKRRQEQRIKRQEVELEELERASMLEIDDIEALNILKETARLQQDADYDVDKDLPAVNPYSERYLWCFLALCASGSATLALLGGFTRRFSIQRPLQALHEDLIHFQVSGEYHDEPGSARREFWTDTKRALQHWC
eukprot:gnl/TRDRNA2_/TRDRNA2_128848_c0_seq2.p1 gnl/TRDRNA2_/TRDRNA2_128848_c0~~gnl/TRDRNA2_/TRDRNA2_128848_c0_seq2.p1  ORF type:complete len:524 (+),score=100.64 gnl/TRDRNA2_/TRDRNA2_128848_c0_seq2:64-1635(+)